MTSADFGSGMVERLLRRLLPLVLILTSRAAFAAEAEDRLISAKASFAAARGARQIVPLLQALAFVGSVPPDDAALDEGEALLAFVKDVSEKAEEPLVRDRARLELARLYDRRGRFDDAEALRRTLGF